MTKDDIRKLLLQSQPDVYRAGGDSSVRVDLQQAAKDQPDAVIEVLLEDLIWRLMLENMMQDEATPSVDQILSLARQGDFEQAYARTQLAFNLDKDRQLLAQRYHQAANEMLTDTD